MSQFRSTGGLDDSIASDGDRGFFAVNQRLQLNQLQPGEVRESVNGRMEGFWKPRKGVLELTSAFTTGEEPLALPFYLVGSSVAITAASVAAGVVTLTTASAHGLTNGSTLNIEGIGYTTGTDPNGVFTATTASGTSITYPLTGGSGSYITTSASVITSTSKAITDASIPTTGTVRIEIVGHGFDAGSSGWATVSGLDSAVNGDYLLSYYDVDHLEYSVPSITSITDKVGTLSQMPINDAANANVRGSCLFSDPNSGNKEYAIIALDTVAKKVDLDTLVATDIAYPPGQALGEDVDMLQCFDKVMIFRDGAQAFEWYPNGRAIDSASQAGTTTVTMSVRDHGLLVGATVVIAGLTGGTPANGSYVVTAVPSKDTFQYTFTTSQTQTFGVAAATMTDGFTLSPGGTYTQPQTFNIEAKDVDIVSGLVTATVTGNVTIQAGDIIVVRQAETLDFASMLGQEYQVVSANTTTITWYAPVGDYGTSSTDIFEFGGRFSVGGGFMHQPGAPWGNYFQRRLWVPYYYDQTGPYNSVTFTSRKITDEIAVSDILDTTTYDQIENQFRISGGSADYVVGMHGFYDDGLIVLNRNSLHLISGTQGSLLDTKVTELTGEIGCLARNTIVSRGNMVMFLSDDGIYAVEFLNDYNLRGAEEPISKNIQPYIDRINKNLADKSVGILYDNRYYLAVPLDSAVGANDARGNNAVLVFNFLNKGWESLDTYGDSRFLIENFIVGQAGVRNNLYAVTSNGGLHQMEAVDSSVDRLNVASIGGTVVTPTINSTLISRGYDFKDLERKRFTDAQIMMQNLAGETGEYTISFAAEDPDNSQSIGTTTQFLGGTILGPSSLGEAETASIRCRLGGIRGYTGTMILTRTVGSPKVNSIKVSGSITNRQVISQK
jgi:hypothetical protein